MEMRLLNKAGMFAGQSFYPASCGDAVLTTEIRRADARSLNAYFGIAARKTNQNGRRENCGHLGALFADVDYKETPVELARERYQALGLPASVIVATGGGLHPYWLLNEPLLLTEDGFKTAYSLLRKLVTALGADPAAAEPARVLRIPGTRNFKYDPPRPVELRLFKPERRYPVAELEQALDGFPECKGKDKLARGYPSPQMPPRPDNWNGLRPGEDLTRHASWSTILERHGWRCLGGSGGAVSWCRPGKREGTSATTNYGGFDLFYVVSSNAPPFEAQCGYSKFAAFALLEHQGDFSEAARELRQWGFGK